MSAAASRPIAFAVRGPIAPEDLAGLCERVCGLLAGGGSGPVRCDVSSVPADAVTVDALARLALAARRRGRTVALQGASPELCALVAFMGLGEVLRAGDAAVPPPGAV